MSDSNYSKDLVSQIRSYIDDDYLECFDKAVEVSTNAHHDQLRNSGEKYIIHPLNVALILAKMHLDPEIICGALLHDTLEDTDLTDKNIIDNFGEKIFNLVEGVTNLDKFHYIRKSNQDLRQAENFRKLLLYTLKDIRVILIKLADRLHNLRTISYMQPEKQIRIAQETLDIYAPLANRFGIYYLKSELEDLSFKIINTVEYNKIAKMMDEKKITRENYIKDIMKEIITEFSKYNFEYKIQGRNKDFYSIYQKHLRKNISYEDIYDLLAIRILTNSIEQCYKILGIIHSRYQPINSRFKDYISKPKENNYQSLHTTVIGPEGKRIEFQIRTFDMHLIAEEGIAAHWRYKDSNKSIDKNYLEQIHKIRSFITLSSLEEDFIDSFKSSFMKEEIIVITPGGDFIKLPQDATTIDFAFALHTEIGLTCSGARVNSEFVPLRTSLHNGDVVSIITNKNASPSYDWLRIVKTAKAKSHIKAFFKKRRLADAIQIGKEIFDKKARKNHLNIKNSADLLQIAYHFKLANIQELYSHIGSGKLDFAEILVMLKPEEKKLNGNPLDKIDLIETSNKDETIYLDNISNLMVNFAKCCNPQMGDDIVGYITRGRGITIHRKDCANKNFLKIKNHEAYRIFDISWGRQLNHQKTQTLEIIGANSRLVFYEIVDILNKLNFVVLENSYSTQNNTFHYKLWFKNDNNKNNDYLISYLSKLDGIKKIKINSTIVYKK